MKTLKQPFLLLAALLFVSLAQAQWGNKKIKGNGNQTTITRNTSDYDAIKCAGWMDFILVKGTEGKLTLEGESNLLDHIITEVKNGALIIKTKKGFNLKPSGWNSTIKITIPFQDIENISLSGSGDIITENVINANHLEVQMAGSGAVNLEIKASDLEVAVAGSGDITLTGKTDDLSAKVAGSGDFNGFGLQANNTTVKVAGSGGAEVVANHSLKARVAGSGDIEYKGNPGNEDTKVSGSGSISN